MIRDHMTHVPLYLCPAGYSIRPFVSGDERHWAEIETAAGEFPGQEQALEHFSQFFGPSLDDVGDRCLILTDSTGAAIGTAAAWYGQFKGEERGRVSWVGIVPDHQGKGLAKPLLSAVMARLARDYGTAYLTTQTTSWRAVNLYLAFGFVPYLGDGWSDEGWGLMEQVLQRRILPLTN